MARLDIREKIQYLGRVVAPDKEAATARAMEEFKIERARLPPDYRAGGVTGNR